MEGARKGTLFFGHPSGKVRSGTGVVRGWYGER